MNAQEIISNLRGSPSLTRRSSDNPIFGYEVLSERHGRHMVWTCRISHLSFMWDTYTGDLTRVDGNEEMWVGNAQSIPAVTRKIMEAEEQFI